MGGLFYLDQSMHLLYLDESGSSTDPSQQFFVLAGISVFERETHWIEQDLNAIAARFNTADPHSIELHGSPMRSGKGSWRRHSCNDPPKVAQVMRLMGSC
jgi:hypothetical protein